MAVRLEGYINFYHTPSGRVEYSLEQVLVVADQLEDAAVKAVVEEVLAQTNKVRELEVRHRLAQVEPMYGPKAAELDSVVDRALSVFKQGIDVWAAVAEADGTSDPRAAAAVQLNSALFPRGVGFITSQTYVEEYTSVKHLLARVEGDGDLVAAAAQLGLEPLIARLSLANAAFRAELPNKPEQAAPTWDVIRAERATLHGLMLVLVATILGRYPREDDISRTRRDALMGPIDEQQRALAAMYKSHRGVRDIDPATGMELDPQGLLPQADL